MSDRTSALHLSVPLAPHGEQVAVYPRGVVCGGVRRHSSIVRDAAECVLPPRPCPDGPTTVSRLLCVLMMFRARVHGVLVRVHVHVCAIMNVRASISAPASLTMSARGSLSCLVSCMRACVYVVRVHACVHACVCMRACMRVCTCVRACVCVRVSVSAHSHSRSVLLVSHSLSSWEMVPC
jgi:hypothetical protein